MWGKTWIDINDLVLPYPNANKFDIDFELFKQNFTPLKMFKTADDFFLSLGLESNAMSYNVTNGAIIEKPKDRDIVCQPTAWNFADGKDFRITMCTELNFEDFVNIHHVMGLIQYSILYKNQSIIFRSGANPGFHDAVGATIALSVSTTKHLRKIGLLTNFTDNKESNLNALMVVALQKIAFLPYSYLIDKWTWDVYSGNVSSNEWNTRWWYYIENIQKLKAPEPRTNEKNFDPGSEIYVVSDKPSIRYFK